MAITLVSTSALATDVCISWNTISLGSKNFSRVEQCQNKKIAEDIDMGIISKEFSYNV
jgi:hypothetical protein